MSDKGLTPAELALLGPFDCVAYEITAEEQFNGLMDTATGNRWGQAANQTTPVQGPLGFVSIMGSGNGE